MAIITPELRRAAIEEMKNPQLAYDTFNIRDSGDPPNRGKNHPLAWILRGEKALIQENQIMRRKFAYDQSTEMPPRGASMEDQYSFDQDPSVSPPDADTLIEFVRMCLAKCPDRESFLAQLTDLISTESVDNNNSDGTLMIKHNGNGNGDQGIPNIGTMPMDRRRRNGAKDNVISGGLRTPKFGAKPGIDSGFNKTKNFLQNSQRREV